MRMLQALVVVVAVLSNTDGQQLQDQDDTAVSLLDSNEGVASTVVPRSVSRAIDHIKQDRAKAKRREQVTIDVKQAKQEEKRTSKKIQHKAQREIKRENRKQRKDARKKGRKAYKNVIKKSEKSKPGRGQTKQWGTVVKPGVITAKERPAKKEERRQTLDTYTNVVKKHGSKQPKPNSNTKATNADSNCAECKRNCKTGACKSWCGMRWCKNSNQRARNPTAKNTMCKKCHEIGPSEARKRWCKKHNC